MADESPEIYLGPDRGKDEGRKKHRRAQRKAQPPSRNRLAIGIVESGELLTREKRYCGGHGACIFASRNKQKSRVAGPGSGLVCSDQEAFLRRLSTNLISSMVLL